MSGILACLDASPYAMSVCEHAARFSGPGGWPITLAHVVPSARGAAQAQPMAPSGLLATMGDQLRDLGAPPAHLVQATGRFPDALAEALQAADLVVAGKRGLRTQQATGRLGGAAWTLIGCTTAPICLVSRLFLPLSRVLVLLDLSSDLDRLLTQLTRQPWLDEAQLDIVVTAPAGIDAAPRLADIRARLSHRSVEAFSVAGVDLAQGLDSYLKHRTCDLLVLDRGHLADLDDMSAALRSHGIWDLRASVLIV